MRSSYGTSSLLSFSLAPFVRFSDFLALAFCCSWSTPRAVRLFILLSPSPSDVFPELSTRSQDLSEHPGNNPPISSLCFGIPYLEKLMQLVFVCPNANSARSHHFVSVGFVFQYDACRRKFFLRSAFLISSSIRKVILSLVSHNLTRRWRHHYSATYEGRPVRCFGPNDCVVYNSGIGPRTFQTKSFHLTLAVSGHASVSLWLSSLCRVRRSTKYSQMTKQSLVRAWVNDFVDFLLDSSMTRTVCNISTSFLSNVSLWCFVHAWPKIWVRWAYFWVECFGLRRSFRLRKNEAKVKCFLGFLDESSLAILHLLLDPAHEKPLRRPERRIQESLRWKTPSSSFGLRTFTTSSLCPRLLEPSVRRPRRNVEALGCVIGEAKGSFSELSDDEAATAFIEAFVKYCLLCHLVTVFRSLRIRSFVVQLPFVGPSGNAMWNLATYRTPSLRTKHS